MSKRFENGYFALVITCVICLLAIGFVAITFAFSKGYQSADQEHSTYYAERNASEIYYNECLNSATSLDGARQCIKNAEATSREAERAEQDLNAQREMAQWAEGMLWAAWIVGISTLFATIIGIRYVYLTLVATQDMARDTKEVGDAQVTASMDAVKAAREANEVAARQFRMGFKPWISVEMKGPFIDMTTENPIRAFSDGETRRQVLLNARTFIHCFGDIPATIEDFHLRLMEGGAWPYVQNPPPGFGAGAKDFFAIMQNGGTIQVDPRSGITDHCMPFSHIELTPENRTDFMMRPPPITGHVIYSDPMGVRYKHKFAFVAKPAWGGSFTRYGGAEYNGEHEI